MKRMLLFIGLLTVFFHNHGIDNPHFYRANFFWGLPRYERPWLTSFDFHLAGGHAKTGRDAQGNKQPLLNTYGLQNMHVLGNSPGLDPANPIDEILINLAEVPVPTGSTFGNLEFTGQFNIIELVFNGLINIVNGFFFQAYLPFRHLRIKDTTTFIDRTPAELQNVPQWVAFLDNFNGFLQRFDFSTAPINQNGIGDFTVLGGWARNYQDTEYLDFIDVDARIGMLFPTGKRVNMDDVFDLPTGYNGFFGVPLKFNAAVGYWEWLTVGFHLGALFFLERTKEPRLKTVVDQAPYFLLFEDEVEVDRGTIWEVSSYAQVDRIYKGFSLLFGYCFTQKDDDCLQPEDKTMFNPVIANANPLRRSWQMHVLHFGFEWDFAKKISDIGPRIGFFYNYVIGGKRIFNTAMKDAYGGIDILWCF